MSDKCSGGSAWLERDKTCPNINITRFSPMSGPWEGGTNVTIHGKEIAANYAKSQLMLLYQMLKQITVKPR